MSNAYIIDEQISGPNALRIEHERYDISADRYRNVRNSLDKTGGQGFLSVFGRGFSEELPRAAHLDIRPVDNNVTNSRLVS